MFDLCCPHCGTRNEVGLLMFLSANNLQSPIKCVDCKSEFFIEVLCLTRDAQLRNEADDAGQDVAELCDCGEPFPAGGYCQFCGAHARYATS